MTRLTRMVIVTLAAAALAAPAFAQRSLDAKRVEQIEQAVPAKATAKPARPRKVLIFTYAAGFVHGSIPYGAKAVELMGEKTGAYTSVTTDDYAAFDDLSGYDAIVMVNTTGDWLLPRGVGGEPKKNDRETDEQHAARVETWKRAKAEYDKAVAAARPKVESRRANIMKFIEGGGGLVGFHAASDAQYNWKEFGLMIGGYFWGHPWHENVAVKLDEPKHPLLAAFGGEDFKITDEIYQFREPYSRSNLRILLSLDTSKTNMNKGGINRTDGDFAVAWVREVGKGRVFYSSLGHREEIYWNPTILRFYLDGIQFAMGDLKADARPSAKADAGADDAGTSSTTGIAGGAAGGVLFDGSDLDQWTFKDGGWVIKDGAMVLQKGGGYIWTKRAYENFTLTGEFNVSKGCNSGIFFRTNPKDPVQGGFEIQVLDSHGKNPGKHSCGALYDAMPPSKTAVKPAGEWNTFTLTCDGPKISFTLNGQKVVDVNIDDWKEANKNPDGSRNKFAAALKDIPRKGHIGFQDHGKEVAFRDVRIVVKD